jgi:hypothetical protein
MNDKVSYDRPVEAKLYVHLDNGEQFEAGPEDLKRFRLVRDLDAYMVFETKLREVLSEAGLIERDTTEACLNPLRYLVETALCYPELLDHPEHEGWKAIAELEQVLQGARSASE